MIKCALHSKWPEWPIPCDGIKYRLPSSRTGKACVCGVAKQYMSEWCERHGIVDNQMFEVLRS